MSGNTQTPEVFASKSLQVGFAALTFNAAPFDTLEQAAEIVWGALGRYTHEGRRLRRVCG